MRAKKQVVYVCSGIKENKLISQIFEAETIDASNNIFYEQYGIKPQSILGPFYKKRENVLEKNFEVKFKFGENIQGIYNGWQITAMPLITPENCYYLLYNKRVDGKIEPKPAEMIVNKEEIKGLL